MNHFQNGARELNSQMPHGCKAKLESALFIRVYLCKKTVCTVIVWPLKKKTVKLQNIDAFLQIFNTNLDNLVS